MYKVFNQDRIIIFTQDVNNLNLSKEHLFVEVDQLKNIIKHYKKFLKDESLNELVFKCDDAKICFKHFKLYFKAIKAAGGFVKNSNGELLMIFRLGKWDLPKGKPGLLEKKKQAAIRECEEETGVKNLKLHRKLGKTYHIFTSKSNNTILKTSHWYEMSTTDTNKLRPQVDEDITKAKWVSKEQVEKVLDNTYPSLIDLIKNFF